MDIKLTQWGLNTYLDLIRRKTFGPHEYHKIIRPDVLLLKNYPSDPKFSNSSFFHPASLANGTSIPDGYKMKWGKIGPGKIELRVMVAIVGGVAYVCEGYAKTSQSFEQRKLFRFMSHIGNIKKGNVVILGDLT